MSETMISYERADTPLNGGWGDAYPTEASVWDPSAAFEAQLRAEEEQTKARQLSETLEKKPEMAKIVVSFEGEQIDVPSYIERLEAEADSARQDMLRFGGEAAIRAREGVSYAGEVPSPPLTPEPVRHPNYPA